MVEKKELCCYLVPSILSHKHFLKIYKELHPHEKDKPILPGVGAEFIADLINAFKDNQDESESEAFQPCSKTQYDIFKTYPEVEEIYKTMVPRAVSERTFWTEFMKSNFVERNYRGEGQSEVFSEACKTTEQKIAEAIKQHIEESEPVVLRKPPSKSFQLIKNINQHSVLVYRSTLNPKPQIVPEPKKTSSIFSSLYQCDDEEKPISEQNYEATGEPQKNGPLFDDQWLNEMFETASQFKRVLSVQKAEAQLTPILKAKWRKLVDAAKFLLRHFYLDMPLSINYETHAVLQKFKTRKLDPFAQQTEYFKVMGFDMTEDIYRMLDRANDWHRKFSGA